MEKLSTKLIKNTNDFKNHLIKYFNNELEYISGIYLNRDSKITTKCKKCNHIRETSARGTLKFQCPKCKGVNKKTTESFKQEVYNLTKDEYSVIGEYTGSSKKIKIRHNSCGTEWDCIAMNFVRKTKPTRCPVCNQSLKTNDVFKEEFFELINSENFELESSYVNAEVPILFKCKKCGKVNSRKPSTILDKQNDGVYCSHCEKTSQPIRNILKILDDNNIKYNLEVYFPKFKALNGNPFKYDIFIESLNLIIEYDGEQHFDTNNKFYRNRTQEVDKLKNLKIICNNKYSLLRISYKEKNILNDIINYVIFGEGSTTILNDILFINNEKDQIINLNKYYSKRSTHKYVEIEDVTLYDLSSEDIVSSI